MSRSARWRSCALVLLAALVCCSHQAASVAAIDACVLALEPARRVTGVALAPHDIGGGPPSAGACELRLDAAAASATAPRVVVMVYTNASMLPDGQALPDLLRLLRAEAEASIGKPEAGALAGLAELAEVYGFAGQDGSGQLLVGERGVVLELSSRNLGRERSIELMRQLWPRLLAFQPPARPASP